MEALTIYLLLFLSGMLSGGVLTLSMIRGFLDRSYTAYHTEPYHYRSDRGLGLILGILLALGVVIWMSWAGGGGS